VFGNPPSVHFSTVFQFIKFYFEKKIKKMKSYLIFSSVALGSSIHEKALKNDPRSWSCFFDCVGTYFRGDVYCSITWEFESDDYYRCLEPFKEELDQCVAGLRDFSEPRICCSNKIKLMAA